MQCQKILLVYLLILCSIPADAAKQPSLDLFGIAYAPVPLKLSGTAIQDDDFMSEDAKPLWGMIGRDDLSTIRSLGASAVRLYGNNEEKDHTNFLDEAQARGLKVIPGISDYPYTQKVPGNCNATGGNCFANIKASYLKNLKRGFLTSNREYHKALAHIIVMNEPDLKMGVKAAQASTEHNPMQFALAMISAVDGMLEAEKEANVTGELVNFTVTFSFTSCTECKAPAAVTSPAMSQMLVLKEAFMNPQEFNYAPVNDLKAFYSTRFLNSFNTQNDVNSVKKLFISTYPTNFPSTPYFIEEYHDPNSVDISKDIAEMRSISLLYSGTLFLGFSFFEFQKRSDKLKLNEERFGMFELGKYRITTVTLGKQQYPVWCLNSVGSTPQAVAKAFVGGGVPTTIGCGPDPATLPLTQEGYSTVCGMKDGNKAKIFLHRVISHLGGVEVFQDPLREKAATMCTSSPKFDEGPQSLVATLVWTRDHSWQIQNQWISWEASPSCVSQRGTADVNVVGRKVEDLCQRVKMDCANVPKECSQNPWSMADYVFSFYYAEKKLRDPAKTDPMKDCYLGGAATLGKGKTAVHLKNAYKHKCIVTEDPTTTPVTAEGWLVIKALSKPNQTAIFLKRVVEEELNSKVLDDAELAAYAKWAWMAKGWDVLLIQLRWKAWVCGEGVRRTCSQAKSGTGFAKYAYLWTPVTGFSIVVLIAAVFSAVLVGMRPDTTKRWFEKQKALRLNHEYSYSDDEATSTASES
eukprot:TRINITY_DN27276_c0_g1_i1.p1 TRINITY_DN27276_c0_g1~~TRINITY_DN27276_c0_g1_i1.p1  ORF type:complete len:747 (+),score=124.94 TRINITY_DN27276_c0_g1_i1:153-2393(+)